MNATQLRNSTLALALLTATGAFINVANAEESVLKSSNPSQFDRWHGRAGGITGAQRIEALHAADLPPAKVSVTYDEDVAARTNMQRDGVDKKDIGVTYDEAVAARTNMARDKQQTPAAVAKSQK
jgi:hypothetical protein